METHSSFKVTSVLCVDSCLDLLAEMYASPLTSQEGKKLYWNVKYVSQYSVTGKKQNCTKK